MDIQAKLAAGKEPRYERWTKVFNIKQIVATLAYIQDNGLTDYEQLAQKATEATDHFHILSEQSKQMEQTIKTNAGLKAATVQYVSAMPEKFKDFQILHSTEEKVNPKLAAYQVEPAQVEAEIEKLLDTRRQTISKAISDLSVETISPQQIKKLSYYLDN